ncbi:MAG: hypothetical protein KF684_10340 [Phycisphaeraceae bacterium]|nr:hypothetical protein [Phycisphaeraceae bacterium]
MSARIMKLCCVSFALALFAVAFTGCNAVDGAGKDLQEASENTKKAFD